MEKIIDIPDGIEVNIDNFKVSIKGPKGNLKRDFFSPLFRDEIIIRKEDNKIFLSTKSEKRKIKSMFGTIEAHIKNMFKGVTEGFSVKLRIVYMHFPMKVEVSGKEILINNFLGERVPRRAKIIGNCKVDVKDDVVTVSGINKDDVGQTAANMEKATWVKARDRRVFQDGIFRLSD